MMKRIYILFPVLMFSLRIAAQTTLSDTVTHTALKAFAACDGVGRPFVRMQKNNSYLNFILKNDQGSTHYFVSTDTSFQNIWAKSFTASGDTDFVFSSFQVTPSGRKLLSGTYYKYDSTGYYVNLGTFIACWNSDDSLMWCRQWESGTGIYPPQVFVFENGNIAWVLSRWSNITYETHAELFLLSENGDLLLARKEKESSCLSGSMDAQGKFVYLASSGGYVMKIDEYGSAIWSKYFSSLSPYYFKTAIAVSENEIAVLGSLDVMKLDVNGNFKWLTHPVNTGKGGTSYGPLGLCSIGDSGFVETILVTIDMDYFSFYSYGLLTFDKNGNLKNGESSAEAITDVISVGGKAVTSGSNFLYGLDEEAPQSCFSFSSANDWSYSFNTPSLSDQSDLVIDYPDLNPFRPLDLQPVSVRFDTFCIVSITTDMVLSDTSSGGSGATDTTTNNVIPTDSMNHSFAVYPNPVHNVLYFSHDSLFQGGGNLSLFDLEGRKLIDVSVPEAKGLTTINLENLPSSVYILRIDYDHQVRKMKIVKS